MGISGNGSEITKMMVLNGRLVLGGHFSSFNDHARPNIVSWDGASGFDDMPGAFGADTDRIFDMAEYDGALFVAGSDQGHCVERWQNGEWARLGGSFNARVASLAFYAGDLYACGPFTSHEGAPLEHIARWNGTEWTSAGIGLAGTVDVLAVFQGALYAGGRFSSTTDSESEMPMSRLARWDGEEWTSLIGTSTEQVNALLTHQGVLWVGEGGFFGTNAKLLRYTGTTFNEVDLGALPYLPALDQALFPLGASIGWGGDRSLFIGDRITLENQRFMTAAELNGTMYIGGRAWTDNGEYPAIQRVPGFGKVVAGRETIWFNAHGLKTFMRPGGSFLWDSWIGGGLWTTTEVGDRRLILSHGHFLAGFANGEVHVSPLDRYDHAGVNGPGPSSTTSSSVLPERFQRVWEVDRGMIWQHATDWDQPGYAMPDDLRDWPGNGDPGNDEPARLAPFTDLDMDGAYDPAAGETPQIRGDRCAWSITNDHFAPTIYTPVGMDATVMPYAFEAPPPALDHVQPISYQFINRSTTTYDSVYVGLWTDFDIGDWNNDLIGSAPGLDMYYGYNATDEEIMPDMAFPSTPPAIGVVALNARMNSFIPLYDSPSMPGHAGFYEPANEQEYTHFLNGLNTLGEPLFAPGSSTPTRFYYDGLPNDPDGFNMPYQAFSSHEAGIASFGPFYDIAPGDTLCFDIAFVMAHDPMLDHIGNAMHLRERARSVHDWYDSVGHGCGKYLALRADDRPSAGKAPLLIQPNPAMGLATLSESFSPTARISLWSTTGQRITDIEARRSADTWTIDLAALDAGIYVVRVQDGDRYGTGRIVKVR